MIRHSATAMSCVFFVVTCGAGEIDRPWKRHTIDNSSRGADGTRLADANGDGLMDIVTPWEQGGITRVYLNPGPELVAKPWPAVTVGDAASAEDAVFVDLDGDGSLDVVSCCEGKRQVMLVHWAPDVDEYLDPEKWHTTEIPGSENRMRWMYATPMDVDDDGQVDIVAGGKGENSELGWWKVPSNPRDVEAWRWNPLRPMGWLMSVESVDMDDDGDLDILFTDRKGDKTGCYWLERTVGVDRKEWREHSVGLRGREAMFLRRVDLDGDSLEDILVTTRPLVIAIFRRLDFSGTKWEQHEIAIPQTYGGAKAPNAADLDGDGRNEIVFSTERAEQGRFGVGRVVTDGDIFSGTRQFTSISGVDGIKHDLVELMDLDADGDLDVVTCEERRNLGVIWYENPRN